MLQFASSADVKKFLKNEFEKYLEVSYPGAIIESLEISWGSSSIIDSFNIPASDYLNGDAGLFVVEVKFVATTYRVATLGGCFYRVEWEDKSGTVRSYSGCGDHFDSDYEADLSHDIEVFVDSLSHRWTGIVFTLLSYIFFTHFGTDAAKADIDKLKIFDD